TSDLPTNIDYPGTKIPMLIWDLCDMRGWYYLNNTVGIPYTQGISGKNDVTTGWVQKFHWFDSMNLSLEGGTWYWDQRNHTGDGANFDDSETTPDYLRFSIKRSYLSFANCTINQDPGNGDVHDGDPYGA